MRSDQAQPQLDMAQHATLLGARDLRAIGVFARLAESCTSAAHRSRSRSRRGCTAHSSSASVATATVCSISPPMNAWWAPARPGPLDGSEHGARRRAARSSRSPSKRSSSALGRGRTPRAPDVPGSRRARRGRGVRPVGNWPRPARRAQRARSARPRCAADRESFGAPFTRTSSPRSKRPASTDRRRETPCPSRARLVAQLDRQIRVA